MSSIVIHHPKKGVFLQRCQETIVWSLVDPIGLDMARCFRDIDEAQAEVKSWPPHESEEIQFADVDIEYPDEGRIYADMPECVRAGLPSWEPFKSALLDKHRRRQNPNWVLIRRYLEISIQHLSPATVIWLKAEYVAREDGCNGNSPSLLVQRHKGGWYVYGHEQPELLAIPPDLCDAIRWAQLVGGEWLNFDADAPVYDHASLPVFDHKRSDR